MCRAILQSRNIIHFLKWKYLACISIWEKLSEVVIVCWPAVHHKTEWFSDSIARDTSKWSHVKLSLTKDTYSLERKILIFIVSVFDVCRPIRFPFVLCTHSQSNFNLRDLLNRNKWKFCLIRMPYSVYEFFFKLEISYFETFDLFVETKAR